MSNKKFTITELEELEHAYSNFLGTNISAVENGMRGVEVHHLGLLESPVIVSYQAAGELLQEYRETNILTDYAKTESLAKITLALASQNDFRSAIYTMPFSLMDRLKDDVRKGNHDLSSYLLKTRHMTEEELYSLPLEDLKYLEGLVNNPMLPGSMVIIPKIIDSEEADEMTAKLDINYRRYSSKIKPIGVDNITFTGLNWIFEEEIQELAKTEETFKVTETITIRGDMFNPPEISNLTRREREKILGSMSTFPYATMLDKDDIHEILIDSDLEEKDKLFRIRGEY